MAYQFAGRYIEALLKNVNGRPRLLASTLVTIYESDGTTEATVYTDRTKATEAANPVMTDTLGNLAVWLEPGSYYGSPIIDGVAQVAFPMHVDIDPAEADAPTATDVTVTPAGGIAATNVQAALVELDTEKATTGSVTSVSAALTAHEGDAGDAHDASAVSFAPAGTIAATDVQAAIVEVSSDVTTEAAARAAGDALLIPLTQKAAANGVATLGADSKIPTAQLPDLAISAFLGTTASQAAMLALVGQRGDWTVRTDTDPDTTWMLVDDDPSILANWRQLSTVTDAVASVNGRTGAVVGLAEAADLTAETNARTAADALLAPLASPTFTGVATAPALKASGLTGAVAASRYVGATASGAPVSGTFLVGDFIIDQSAKVWICTVAGTPGTWVSASGTSEAVVRALSVNERQGDRNKRVMFQRGDVLYAQSQDGLGTVYKSTDFGVTWTTKATAAVFAVLIRVEQTGTLIGVTSAGASWYSTNDGTSWTAGTAFTYGPLGSQSLCETPSGYILYAEYSGVSGGTYRIMRSTNDGVSFTQVKASPTTGTGARHWHSVTYDTYADKYVAFMDGDVPEVWQSADEGATWTQIGVVDDSVDPNFVSPMFFENYVAWGYDSEQGGVISRLPRAAFYSGAWSASQVVATVNPKAFYFTFPLSEGVWLVTQATESIGGGDPLGYSQELFVVSDDGATVSAGIEHLTDSALIGTLNGQKTMLPSYDQANLANGGRTWASFNQGANYITAPVTVGRALAGRLRSNFPLAPTVARVFRTGYYYGPGPHIPVAAAMVDGTLTAVPFWLPVDATFDRIACHITSAGVALSVVRMGIWSSMSLDSPSLLVVDAGTVDASTTGEKAAVISQRLTAGLYWLGVVAQGGTPTIITVGVGHLPPVANNVATSAPAASAPNGYYRTGIAGALSNWTGGGVTTSSYKVQLRAA